MELGLTLPESELDHVKSVMYQSAMEAYKAAGRQQSYRPYMTKAEAGSYLHVSQVKLNEFIQAGLQVTTVQNITRISKDSCDTFMKEHLI